MFCELGRALEYELDFLHEAQAAEKIWAAVCHTIGGEPASPSLVVPRPIPNLATRRYKTKVGAVQRNEELIM